MVILDFINLDVFFINVSLSQPFMVILNYALDIVLQGVSSTISLRLMALSLGLKALGIC